MKKIKSKSQQKAILIRDLTKLMIITILEDKDQILGLNITLPTISILTGEMINSNQLMFKIVLETSNVSPEETTMRIIQIIEDIPGTGNIIFNFIMIDLNMPDIDQEM